MLAHLRAENAYTTAMLEPHAPLVRTLYSEIAGRIPGSMHMRKHTPGKHLVRLALADLSKAPAEHRQEQQQQGPAV